TFAFFVISMSFLAAKAQNMPDYVFLEVVDSGGKPVPEATVEITNRYNSEKYTGKTDEEGRMQFELGGFTDSKPAYFPFPDFGIQTPSYKTKVKLELLKIPQTKTERRIVGEEQRKREFLWAAKTGDAAGVSKLLTAGVSPNIATRDLRGVSGFYDLPAII